MRLPESIKGLSPVMGRSSTNILLASISTALHVDRAPVVGQVSFQFRGYILENMVPYHPKSFGERYLWNKGRKKGENGKRNEERGKKSRVQYMQKD
jgi:hypothetical protein